MVTAARGCQFRRMSSILPVAIDPSDVHVHALRASAPAGDLSRIGRRLTEIATELTAARRGPGLATCRRHAPSLARPLTLLLDVQGGDIVACNLQFGRGAWWALSELVDEVGRIARESLDPRAPRERGWTTRRTHRESLACFATTFDDVRGSPVLVLVTVVEELLEAVAPGRLLVDTRLPMWAVDRRTLRLLDANDAVVAAYGYSREKLLGMRLTDLMADPAEIPGLVTSLAEWSGAEDLRWEGSHRCADGDLAQVELLMRASDDGGAPIAFVLGRVAPGVSGTWSTMRIA
jgi:PAS domain S-box-containing protein